VLGNSREDITQNSKAGFGNELCLAKGLQENASPFFNKSNLDLAGKDNLDLAAKNSDAKSKGNSDFYLGNDFYFEAELKPNLQENASPFFNKSNLDLAAKNSDAKSKGNSDFDLENDFYFEAELKPNLQENASSLFSAAPQSH
jgi:hypothetical protein